MVQVVWVRQQRGNPMRGKWVRGNQVVIHVRQREIQVRKTGIHRKVVRGSGEGLHEVKRVLDQAKFGAPEVDWDLGMTAENQVEWEEGLGWIAGCT